MPEMRTGDMARGDACVVAAVVALQGSQQERWEVSVMKTKMATWLLTDSCWRRWAMGVLGSVAGESSDWDGAVSRCSKQ